MPNFPNAFSNIEDGLISAWFLEEEGGTPANDAVNGNDLLESNANDIPPGPTTGNLGSGRVFGGNASSQGLVISDIAQTNLGGEFFNGGDGLSIIAWVNHKAFGASDRVITVKGTDSTDDEYDLHWDFVTQKWTFRVTNPGGSQTSVRADNFNAVHGVPASGIWYMVYAEWDNILGKIKIEIDASGINDTNFLSTLNNSNKDFKIGAYQPGAGVGIFDGTIAYVGIWDRPLTFDERRGLHNDGEGWQIPFTNFIAPPSGAGFGGYIRSVTPTNATPSGFFGGYTARYLDAPTSPARFGGYIARYLDFPNENPNTCSSGLTSLSQEGLCSFWPFNEPSGTIRRDLKNVNNAIPQPYKKRFEGDKISLNNGLVSYFDMEEHKKTGRMDSAGTNHLSEVSVDVPKVVGLVSNGGSGVRSDGFTFLTRASPNEVSPGSGDFTVVFWFRQDSAPTTFQGLVSKGANNNRSWGTDIINTNNVDVPLQGRPRFFACVNNTCSIGRSVSASGVNLGANTPSAPEILLGEEYFFAGRLKAVSGQIDVTWASGTDFSTRFKNFSDPLPDLTASGIFEGTASLDVLSVNFTTNRILRGVISSLGIYSRYLSDAELELMFGSGLGQKPEPVNDANTITADPDPLGPASVSGHVIPVVSGVGFGFGGGGGLPGRAGINPRPERLIIPHTQGNDFDFDGSTSFTFAGWVRFPDLFRKYIFTKSIEINGDRAYRLSSDGANRIQWEISNSIGTAFTSVTATTPTLSANTYHFVVCGWDKDAAEMFVQVDNSTVFTTAKSASDFGRSDAAFMWGDGNLSFDNFAPLTGGSIDSWGFWKRILNTGEKTILYNAGVGTEITQSNIDTCFSDPFFEGFFPAGNTVGGFMFSKANQFSRNNQFFGGYTRAPGFTNSAQFGGFLLAQPLFPGPTTRPATIGGMASGLFEPDPGNFGGWTFGRPADTQFIEQHSRTLVKVRSRNVVDQGLDLDSQLILSQVANEEFNAKFIFFDTSDGTAQFNARLNVEAFKILPSGVGSIVCEGPDASGAVKVIINASGIALETDTFFTSAEIDFGEPYGFGGEFGGGGISNPLPAFSISGFNFATLQASAGGASISGFHVYQYPGRYIITTKFVDNTGQAFMQGFVMNNISSGSIAAISGVDPVEGEDFPAIEISGTPRRGRVPLSVFVDYDLRASGAGFAEINKSVADLNKATPATNEFLNWNFANGNFSTIKQPFSNYPNPGIFIPVARYQFIHPSGELLATSGGPPNGSGELFGPRPIWISDSLSIGFGQ